MSPKTHTRPPWNTEKPATESGGGMLSGPGLVSKEASGNAVPETLIQRVVDVMRCATWHRFEAVTRPS